MVDRYHPLYAGRAFFRSVQRDIQCFTKNDRAWLRAVYRACGQGSDLTTEDVDAVAQGRVWHGEKALSLGLVDELGDLETAANVTAELAGLSEWSLRYLSAPVDPRQEILRQLLQGAFPLGDGITPIESVISSGRKDLRVLSCSTTNELPTPSVWSARVKTSKYRSCKFATDNHPFSVTLDFTRLQYSRVIRLISCALSRIPIKFGNVIKATVIAEMSHIRLVSTTVAKKKPLT